MTDRARSTLASKKPLDIARLAGYYLKHSVDDLHQDLVHYYFSHNGSGQQSSPGDTTAQWDNESDRPHPQPTMVVVNPMCQRQGTSLAEKWGIPLVVLRYAPISQNSYSGWPQKITRFLPGWVKKKSWHAQEWLDFLMYWYWENSFRRRLGLSSRFRPFAHYLREHSVPQIQLCDPAVVPHIAHEWSGTEKIFAGYLDLPTSARQNLHEPETLPADLDQWMSSGDAPLFVSFGSMPVPDPESIITTITDVARTRGLRVLFSGLSHPSPVGDPHASTADSAVCFTGAVNQSAVLPRCCAAVHHGGAGTTAASLRSGVPTMIYAFGFEQPFWASCIEHLGVGVGSTFSRLTRENFAMDLDRALSASVCASARTFAATMTTPDEALSTAVRIIEDQAV